MTINKALLALALGLALAAVTTAPGLKATSRNQYHKELIDIDHNTQMYVVEDEKHANVCYFSVSSSTYQSPISCVANH